MTGTIPAGLSENQAALMRTLMGAGYGVPAAPPVVPAPTEQQVNAYGREVERIARKAEAESLRTVEGQLAYQRAQREARRLIEAEDGMTLGLDGLRAALLDSAGLDTVPDPVPLIGRDLMFTDSLVWLIGRPGSMKSFVALDIAGHVAAGTWWQGYPTTAGPVLYLLAEGMSGTRQRVRAWEHTQRHPIGVRFLPVAVQAGNPTDWDALAALVAELRPRLIVIDTQARVTVGLEENSNTEMGRFVHQLDRLRQASGACVMVVHHLTRNGDNGRGASAIDGAMNTIVKVDKADSTITLECAKSKDGPEWSKITLRPVQAGESVVLTYVSEHETPDLTVERCRSWLQVWYERHRDEWVSVATLTDTGGGGTAVVAKNTFHTNKFKLIDAGAIRRDGEGRATRYQLAPSSVIGPIWVLSPAPKGGGTGTQYPIGPSGLSGTDPGLGTQGGVEANEPPAHAPAAPPDDLGPSVPTRPRRARRSAAGTLALRALTGK